MNGTESQALLSALQARGLIAADVVQPGTASEQSPERPWYISLLLGTSGWLAGAFVLGFVAVLLHSHSAEKAAAAGLVLLAIAWGLFRADRDGTFTSQLALALSVAGQCLTFFAMTEHSHHMAGVAATALALQTSLVLIMPNRLHRVMSTLFAAIAWALMLRFGLFGGPNWSAERDAAPSLAAALSGWALAWAPIGLGLWWLIRSEPVWVARGWSPVLRPVLSGLIIGLAFATLISQPFESFRWWGSAPVRQDWLALWPLLSAGAALGAVVAAFALSHRALMGACVVAVLLHVSHFYYELGASLLLKSLLMLVTGAALLVAARWVAAPADGVKA